MAPSITISAFAASSQCSRASHPHIRAELGQGEADLGDRDPPNGDYRRSCRAPRGLRPDGHRLQLLLQPRPEISRSLRHSVSSASVGFLQSKD